MDSTPANLVSLFEKALRDNWNLNSLADYNGQQYTYREVAEKILNIHYLFAEERLQRGDKVSLLGKNSAQWGILYLATVTYGAVIVPILPDFKPADVQSIVNHSDSLLLFAEEGLYKDLNPARMPGLKKIIRLHDLAEIHPSVLDREVVAPSVAAGIRPEDVRFEPSRAEEVAVISYTSGTTGYSKGVVLPHRSLLGNILFAHRNMPLNPKDRILSFLPLAHTYGCAFEFLFPFTLGCDITFLTKTPSPKIIIQAFGEIRPALILSVPLVIEKIYKAQLLPVLSKPVMKALLNIPGINQLLFRKIHRKLSGVFGGNFRELIIGGAPFNTEAEKFFRKIRFPFTVGYGMTECGPLISYASWKTTVLGASGRVVDELQVKIDSPDPLKIAGEIMVRGAHVMQGYYKNEEATRAILGDDGWLHTGDLGVLDKAGNIHIKGRSKSMILGPSGKNIYPEEIESILNNRLLVMESLVIERDERIIAKIFPDYEALEKSGHSKEELPAILKGYIHEMNHHLPKYMAVHDFEIHPAEFEKTPKRSIKRYLYQ